uniref:AlNc14C317G10550 protein n=1 Tax=Albugo laibachii Nc14 TaxID=890382 RepID=F0WWB5_9STRA|nr:AlNc14C317G10550 [Albugo laibachii Nc14]|eukprot:CCA25735.1 AlNc14C317G10550 [Albugo laibachii Nc14]
MQLKGSADFLARVDDEIHRIRLRDVYYLTNLPCNILSYGVLEERGYELRYNGHHRSMVRRSDGFRIFDVEKDSSNVRIVRVITDDADPCTAVGFEARKAEEYIALTLAEASSFTIPDAQTGSLLDFHLDFAHHSYDTIELMASDPASGILLTDKSRPACLTCAQGKQKRNTQPLMDTGVNAPIDHVGGVTCSDIKGPITPVNRW